MPILTPYQATVAPGTLLSAVGTVGVCYDKAKTGNALARRPLFSVREVIGNLKKMLWDRWEAKENTPFFLKCDSGGHHSTREE